MKKQWRKTYMAVLAMGLLAFGVAGCSDGTIFGIQIGGSDEEGIDYSKIAIQFPVVDSIRTPEEIKAAGEEITIEDVKNAFDYFAYNYPHNVGTYGKTVSAKFVKITPSEYPQKIGEAEFEYYEMPYYTECYTYDKYYINILLESQTTKCESLITDQLIYVPNEFSQFLESAAVDSELIDDAFYKKIDDKNLYYTTKGNIAYEPVTIDEAFFDQLAEQGNTEAMEAAINFIIETCKKFDELNPIYSY